MITEDDEWSRIEREIKRRAAQEPSRTTLRQAAQQALEALCSAVEPKKGKVYAREFELIDCYAMHEQAITALREALKQPEQRKPLTDEEMMRIYVELKSVAGFYSVEKFARAIEAKLKEQP